MNAVVSKIIERINNSKRIGVFGHIKTDGDSIASVMAFGYLLESMDKDVSLFIDSDFPENLCSFDDVSRINSKPRENFDLLIAVDTAISSRLGENEKYFLKHNNTILIDHHVDSEPYAKLNYCEEHASSTCEVLFGIFENLVSVIPQNVANWLLIGLLTDTGCLRYDSVSSKTLEVASKLSALAKVKWQELVNNLFYDISKIKRLVEIRAGQNMKFFHDDQIAVVYLRYSDFVELGASAVHSKGLSYLGLDIKSIKMIAVVGETKRGEFSITFYGKPGANACAVANYFGGGGHTRAAGCKLYGDFDELLKKIVPVMWDEIK